MATVGARHEESRERSCGYVATAKIAQTEKIPTPVLTSRDELVRDRGDALLGWGVQGAVKAPWAYDAKIVSPALHYCSS
jgi:hypothetical protein